MTTKRGRRHTTHVVVWSPVTDTAKGNFRCRRCGLRFHSAWIRDLVGQSADEIALAPPEPPRPGEERAAPPITEPEEEPSAEPTIPAGVFGRTE